MTATCWSSGCGRKATITIRDGRTYCKRHGDRVPRYQRRTPGQRSGTASAASEITHRTTTKETR